MNLSGPLFITVALASTASAASNNQPTLVPPTPITTQPATFDDTLPQTVQLTSGERVIGLVIARTEDAIVIESAALGVVTVKTKLIDKIIVHDAITKPTTQPTPPAPTTAPSIQPVPAVSNADTPAPIAPPPAPPAIPLPPADRGLFRTGLFAGWTRRFEAGFSGTSGTTDTTAINGQFSVSTDNPKYRATLAAFHFFAADSGTTTRSQTRVTGTNDRRLDDGPWFLFARGQYDNDALQNWENRASAFGGFGYEFIRTPKYELLGRVGLGQTIEFGGTYPDGYENSRFEALVGVDAKWVINPTQSLVGSSYYYPTLTDFDYGRIVSTAAYQIDLTSTKNIALKIGVEHIHELRTAGDDEHNNFKYYTNIVIKL